MRHKEVMPPKVSAAAERPVFPPYYIQTSILGVLASQVRYDCCGSVFRSAGRRGTPGQSIMRAATINSGFSDQLARLGLDFMH
jgi:hypothetical protein